MICYRCKRDIPADKARPILLLFKVLASFSLAPFHVGLWMWTYLSNDFCVSCRRRLSLMSMAGALFIGALVALGFWWAIGKGLFPWFKNDL